MGRMDLLGNLKEMRALLVDDDELVRDALGMALRKKGLELLAVETAEEGLRALQKGPFDIVIADYKLPGIDGLEFFKQATRCDHDPDPIKVLITAYGDDDVAAEAFRIGIHDFMTKPFSAKTVLETLALLIEKRNRKGDEPGIQTSSINP
jgi:DNA-binding NtrC family response regulator